MSLKNFYFCIVIVCFLLTSISFAEPNDLPYKEGELLVKFAPKSDGKQKTSDEHSQILSSLNAGTVKKSLKLVPGLTVVKLPAGLKVKDALSKFKGKADFLYAEPNWKITLLSTEPNDLKFDQQWGRKNSGVLAGFLLLNYFHIMVKGLFV